MLSGTAEESNEGAELNDSDPLEPLEGLEEGARPCSLDEGPPLEDAYEEPSVMSSSCSKTASCLSSSSRSSWLY